MDALCTLVNPPTTLGEYQKQKEQREKDLVSKIIDYEMGELSQEKIIDFFQELIDSGMAWSLQGSYGRTANDLIEMGLCHKKE